MAHVLYMLVFDFVQPRGKEREGRDGGFLEFAGEGRYKENRHLVRYRVKKKGYKCGLKGPLCKN